MSRRFERILQDLDEMTKAVKDAKAFIELKKTKKWFQRTCQKGFTFRIGRVQDLYNVMIPILKKVAVQYPSLYTRAANISKQLVALEVIPEAWKQTQFWHVSNFPKETCPTCGQPICLQCGEGDHHPDQTCLGHLRLQLQSGSEPAEKRATLEWKLNHTQPCPNCSVMIHRDEGCNKVDCLLCGYRFCWSCRVAWSQAELGVPDMNRVEARREAH
ncbi:E3 ubiquitin-protein ligase arih2 [Apophysomyces ossiformis]|uniref:E3 ubiquitin-protein ligase arih2 n=1 Tax=Apophysomyces ossiformis TaxID=679940 RepID=A0A8H7BZF4_9FUNG|nr:E3 ubiquitin-protein ligase arih2 [Apophysomyces ossiformis]